MWVVDEKAFVSERPELACQLRLPRSAQPCILERLLARDLTGHR